MTEKREVKRFNEHAYNVKLEQIQRVAIPSLIKKRHLLTRLEKGSLNEFENNLLDLTGFKSVEMAVKAYEMEAEWEELKKYTATLSKFNLTEADLTKDGKLTKAYLNALREEFTIYYNDEELKQRKELDSVIKAFNSLDSKSRSLLAIDRRKQELVLNPMYKSGRL